MIDCWAYEIISYLTYVVEYCETVWLHIVIVILIEKVL